MKKNLIVVAIASIAMLAVTSKTNAQIMSNHSPLEYHKALIGDQDNISQKAIRNFAKTYGTRNNEGWTQIKDGFIARFISDGIDTKIYYDQKGNWIASIKYYNEDKLRHDVRHVVKSTYYDYAIVGIQEIEGIESNGVPTYVIDVENKSEIKLLRVYAENMEVFKQFDKTN